MSNTKQSAAGNGIGLGGMLFVLFIGLKLTGYIDWSWWWVSAPLWIPLAIALTLMVSGGMLWCLGTLIGAVFGSERSARRSR